jgi:Replication-relaxation
MPRTRLPKESARVRVEMTPAGIGEALAERGRLTRRDLALLELLHEHQVLTGDQIARLYYTSPTTARHRLLDLARRGVLARFRHHPDRGSQAWRYTIGPVGAMLQAATHGRPLPRPSRTSAQILALATSPRLDHLLAVNDVFVALAHAARTPPVHRLPTDALDPNPQPTQQSTQQSTGAPTWAPAGAALSLWWSEQRATAAFGQIVRPDGYGEWTEHQRSVRFFLELDRGTEPLPRLLDKLTGYRQLTDHNITHPVLFLLPTSLREQHLHRHIATRPALCAAGQDAPALLVATAAHDQLAATGATPADPVWLRPGHTHRARLINLVAPTTSGMHEQPEPPSPPLRPPLR